MTEPSPPAAPPESEERVKLAVEIWKHSVSVQMHFNDMEMRVRNLYITILAAALGLIGLLQGKNFSIPALWLDVSLPFFVVLSIVPVSMLFYFTDRHWYHRLLIGAVNQCMVIEKKYRDTLPEIQLGSTIKDASPVEFKGWVWKALFWFVRDKRFRKGSMLHSDAKIEVLYKTVIELCLFIALIHGFVSGLRYGGCSALAWLMGSECGAPEIWA